MACVRLDRAMERARTVIGDEGERGAPLPLGRVEARVRGDRDEAGVRLGMVADVAGDHGQPVEPRRPLARDRDHRVVPELRHLRRGIGGRPGRERARLRHRLQAAAGTGRARPDVSGSRGCGREGSSRRRRGNAGSAGSSRPRSRARSRRGGRASPPPALRASSRSGGRRTPRSRALPPRPPRRSWGEGWASPRGRGDRRRRRCGRRRGPGRRPRLRRPSWAVSLLVEAEREAKRLVAALADRLGRALVRGALRGNRGRAAAECGC